MSELDNVSGMVADTRMAVYAPAAEVSQYTDHLQRLDRPARLMAGGVADAVAYCAQQPAPPIMLVDISAEAHPLVSVGQLLQAMGPACRLVVVGNRNDVNLYRSLLGEGVSDYLLKPVMLDQLAQVLLRIDEDRGVSLPAAGRTIAITGASGGSGASTVVAGMAQILASLGHAPQALVDFDRRAGDLSLLLGAGPTDGLQAALTSDEADHQLLLRTLARVNERIHLLAQQPGSESAELQPGQALRLGAELCRLFALSIWDIPAQRDAACLEILQHADMRVIVMDLTVQDARKVHRLLNDIGDERMGQRLMLVANASRWNGAASVPKPQFEEFIGRKIDLALPCGGAALAGSLLKGPLNVAAVPVFRDALQGLVTHLTGYGQPAAATGGDSIANRLKNLFTRRGTRPMTA